MNKPIETERRLVAIFAADVEGYSRLMGADEVATLQGLTLRRAILDGLIASHRGRIVNTAGDSVLAEFGSAVAAVQCAVLAQETLAEANAGISPDRHINFRIGVHVGDVMVKGGDLFGDGVNIAARLQTLATPGGISVSGVAHDQVRKILPFVFTDLGDQQVKNIEEPVRAYAVSAPKFPAHSTLRDTADKQPLPIPDKPSIAVLPFQNMSGDPEQDYFADGMVEDIITALSRFKSLFVIARNSSFTYKGKAVDIKQVGRELGVRYVLEGSVRKAGGRVRITGQLIDATSGAHLWAGKFDGALEDVFELQDKVTEQVVGAIAPKVRQAEIDRAIRKPTESLDARDYYYRGLDSFRLISRQGNVEAERLFRRAIELDPNFAAAHGQLAACYRQRKTIGWRRDDVQLRAEGRQFAAKAIALGQDDADALASAAGFLAFVDHEFETAEALIDQALAINPNLFWSWQVRGLISMWLGKHEQAIEQIDQGIRLNPLDPDMHIAESAKAWASLFLRRFDDAIQWATKALARKANHATALRVVAIAFAVEGHLDEAKSALNRLYQIDPDNRFARPTDSLAFRRAEDVALYVEGLRLAGLPE